MANVHVICSLVAPPSTSQRYPENLILLISDDQDEVVWNLSGIHNCKDLKKTFREKCSGGKQNLNV